MSNLANLRNIGALLKEVGHQMGSLTAAGTGDTTALVGQSINRMVNGLMCNFAKINVGFKTTLTAAKTLGLKITVEQSADNSTWGDPVYLFGTSDAYETVATGAVTNKVGTWERDLDLSGYAQYLRITVTPDLSHSGTDTAIVAHSVTLGGYEGGILTADDTVTLY